MLLSLAGVSPFPDEIRFPKRAHRLLRPACAVRIILG